MSISGAIFFFFLKIFIYLFLAVLGLCCFAWDVLVAVRGGHFLVVMCGLFTGVALQQCLVAEHSL